VLPPVLLGSVLACVVDTSVVALVPVLAVSLFDPAVVLADSLLEAELVVGVGSELASLAEITVVLGPESVPAALLVPSPLSPHPSTVAATTSPSHSRCIDTPVC